MFFRTSRIAEDGAYLSPNICFADPDEDLTHGDDHEASADGDEGADQGDADELDGDGDDEGDVDQGDGPEGGEPDEDAAEVDEAAEVEEQPRRRRAGDVIRDQKRNRKEAERRAEEALRRAEEAERLAREATRRAEEAERRATAQREQESRQAEEARLELMSESERIAYYRQKDREEFQKQLGGVQFQIADSQDRMEFRQLCREDPLVAKVKDQVEAEYQRLIREGKAPVARHILADLLVGRMVRQQRQTSGTRQRERASERVRRETVKPTRTRSDVAAKRQRSGTEDSREARRRRLEDVQL